MVAQYKKPTLKSYELKKIGRGSNSHAYRIGDTPYVVQYVFSPEKVEFLSLVKDCVILSPFDDVIYPEIYGISEMPYSGRNIDIVIMPFYEDDEDKSRELVRKHHDEGALDYIVRHVQNIINEFHFGRATAFVDIGWGNIFCVNDKILLLDPIYFED